MAGTLGIDHRDFASQTDLQAALDAKQNLLTTSAFGSKPALDR